MHPIRTTVVKLISISRLCLLVATLGLISGCTRQEIPHETVTRDNLLYLDDSAAYDGLVREGVVLVDFYADWCPPCRLLAPELVQVAESMGAELLVLKVDVDTHGELAGRFGIRSIPFMMLYGNGEVLDTRAGFMNKAQIQEWIRDKTG